MSYHCLIIPICYLMRISNSRMYQKSYRVWFYILTNELNWAKKRRKKLIDKSHLHIDSQDNCGDSHDNNGDEEYLKSIDKDIRLRQQKQREIEQQNISPEEIMEEEEKDNHSPPRKDEQTSD